MEVNTAEQDLENIISYLRYDLAGDIIVDKYKMLFKQKLSDLVCLTFWVHFIHEFVRLFTRIFRMIVILFIGHKGGKMFKLVSNYKPTGDQPQAIEYLVKGIEEGKKYQTLLGVTGSGKTFTMANIINKVQKPTLVLAHNKTLARPVIF